MEVITIVGAVALVAGVVAALFVAARAIRRASDAHPDVGPVEIAKIVDHGILQHSAAGGSGLVLVVASIISMFKYFSAQTTDQQMVALLLWIGNGVFWGSLMVAAMISSGRTSTVYRDAIPAERKEPQL